MRERQLEIVQIAIEIIASNGYGALTMRALAREAGMKLGALQYHFRTRDDLLNAIAAFVTSEYEASLKAVRVEAMPLDIVTLVELLLDDTAGASLRSEDLLPQLWAMGRVEPTMAALLNQIYANYLALLEEALKAAGNSKPRAEAVALMSLIEGSLLFLHTGSSLAGDSASFKQHVLDQLGRRYQSADEEVEALKTVSARR